MFSEFDDYLSLDFLSDYWYDEAQAIAASFLSSFSESDWCDILEICNGRSFEWRVRCAEMMDAVEHPNATRILLGFLSDPEDDVVIAAADGLRSKRGIAEAVRPGDIERLKTLMLQGSAPVRGILADFFVKLNAN